MAAHAATRRSVLGPPPDSRARRSRAPDDADLADRRAPPDRTSPSPRDDDEGPAARSPTATSRGSSTRSATSSRSRARSRSRPSPITAPPTRSRGPRSTSAAAYGAGDRRPIPGVGAAITDKIVELATTGRMAYYEQAARGDPGRRSSTCCGSRASGRRPCGIAWEGLGVTTPRGAQGGRARRGGCASSRASRASTEQRILEGIEKLETRPASPPASTAPSALSDDLAALRRGARRA